MSLHTDPIVGALAALDASEEGVPVEIDANSILEGVNGLVRDVAVTQHPLGFVHLELSPLLQLPAIFRARLHIWTDWSLAWADSLGAIHDHNWRLHSLVLVGGLRDSVLRPVDSPLGEYVATEVVYGPSGTEFRDMPGRFELEEVRRRDVPAGQAYKLESGLLHSSSTLRLPTATLVKAEATIAQSAKVFRRAETRGSGASQRRRLDSTQAERAIEEARSALSS